jgi:zinc transport system substrate-binding protein
MNLLALLRLLTAWPVALFGLLLRVPAAISGLLQSWSARFILPQMPRACALCKINLALLFSLNVMAVTAWAGTSTDSPRLKIVAANYPLAYFAERIGGSRVAVSLPVPTGEDPSFWKPNALAVGEMQKAELILLNGADYEKWLPRVSLPKFKVVDTSAGFKNNYIRIENAVTHSHGPGGMHSHEGIATTTWLDFAQAQQQAEAAANAMARKRPELKAVFMENLQALQADLAELDTQLKAAAGAHKPLLGSHPVYQYLIRRYGLDLQSVHWEPNEMPVPAEWDALGKSLASRPVKWMLWEAKPDEAIANKLKTLGVESVAFDPCGNKPESGDFLGVMKLNVDNLRTALR